MKALAKHHIKLKLSPESNQGIICDWIGVKPLYKSLIATKEALKIYNSR